MLPAPLESATAWQLRSAWARRVEVGLSLVDGRRLRGLVEHVAPTNAFALLWDGAGTIHVPVALVRSVARPHFHEPGWPPPVGQPPRPRVLEVPFVHPGQLALAIEDGRPEWWGTG